MPSIVVTSWPSAWAARTVQDFTATPSSADRAGAALRGVAANVGAGEAQVVAEEVDEEGAGRDGRGARGAVDRQLDGDLTRGGHLHLLFLLT